MQTAFDMDRGPPFEALELHLKVLACNYSVSWGVVKGGEQVVKVGGLRPLIISTVITIMLWA